MNATELKMQLDLLGVKPNQCSLVGDIVPDTIVLFQNYNKWEVFYLDEHGVRDNQQSFESESAACDYILKMFKESTDLEKKYKR